MNDLKRYEFRELVTFLPQNHFNSVEKNITLWVLQNMVPKGIINPSIHTT